MLRQIARTLALAALALVAAGASAQDYPTHPVKIIVPFAAGGPADIYARFIAHRLEKTLKQPFIVEDHPGAGSIIGTEIVAKSPADGYTLLLISNTHTVNESLFAKKPYKLMRDFVPIAPLNYSDLVLVVNPSVPVHTLQDLIKLAKAKPGVLTFASSGPGTPYHMAGELFNAMAGISILHVPFRGSSGARTSVLGGQVNMMFDAVTTMTGFARSGKVRALATTGLTRSAVLPDVPTMSEAGVPGYQAVIWLGLVAPVGTPAAIVNKLNAEITKIVAEPEVRAQWAKQGASPLSMTPAEFADYINKDIVKWARVVKISGARVDR